jgi:hypothetical protein
MLEKKIEGAVKQYARTQGFLAYKWTSPNHIGVPDCILISPHGQVLFIEFKQKGKLPTPMQAREHQRMIANGAHVFVIDDMETGKALVDTYAASK